MKSFFKVNLQKSYIPFNNYILKSFSTQIKPDLNLVKQLRNETNSPLNHIQKALIESLNNIDEAKVWLKKKGFKDAENKMKRESTRKLFGVKYYNNKLVHVEFSCETDFVAQNEIFLKFCQEVLENIQTSVEDKLDTTFIGNSSINEMLKSVITKTGENCKINKSEVIELNSNQIGCVYLHSTDSSLFSSQAAFVILSFKGNADFKRLYDLGVSLGMQIVAMNPKFIQESTIPPNTIIKEKEIILEKVNNIDKPDNIKNNLLETGWKKFIEESCLLNQEYVISSSKFYTTPKKVSEVILDEKKFQGLDEIKVDRFEYLV